MARKFDREEYIRLMVDDIKYMESREIGPDEILEQMDGGRDNYGSFRVTDAMLTEAFKRCGYEIEWK